MNNSSSSGKRSGGPGNLSLRLTRSLLLPPTSPIYSSLTSRPPGSSSSDDPSNLGPDVEALLASASALTQPLLPPSTGAPLACDLLGPVLAPPAAVPDQPLAELQFLMAPPLTPSAGQLVADKSPSPSATIVEEHDEMGHCKHFTMHESQIPAWLDREQKAGNFRFVQCGGKKKRVRGWYCKYVCHCYGRPEIKAKDKMAVLEGRVAKSTRKSKKVGCPCAAYVTCDIDGTATIRYFPMHHGHELTKKSARKHSRRVARNSSSESSSTTLPTEPLSPVQYTPIPDTPLISYTSMASSATTHITGAGALASAGELSKLYAQDIQIAPAPAPYATTGLTQWMALWKTLGHLPFVETEPFSFGFVRAQAASCLPSPTDHCPSLVLSLERAMGTNINGYPLYTLSVLDPEDSSSEHLAYLVTADMSHGAVQRWLVHLRDTLHMSPQTCILDPDDIAGHAAVNMAFGSECLVLW
ncbi:hypothetical protein EC988_001379, partial [Linderina pennispora]